MNILKQIIIASAVIQLTACSSGVKLANTNYNKDLPNAIKQRAVYPAGVAIYEFEDLVGNILSLQDGQNPLRKGIIRPSGYTPVQITITDLQSENFYHSLIKKGAEANGSYLAFAAKFKADDVSEVTISDIARSGIILTENNWNEIKPKIIAWASLHPKNAGETRIWIKAVVVSRETTKDLTDITGDTSAQIGNVVSVEGKVYNSRSEETRTPIISFEALDIDELAVEAKDKSNNNTIINNTIQLTNLSKEIVLYKNDWKRSEKNHEKLSEIIPSNEIKLKTPLFEGIIHGKIEKKSTPE